MPTETSGLMALLAFLPILVAGILLIGLIGLLTDQAFRWIGRRAFHWQKR